jgi:hypothetical protein
MVKDEEVKPVFLIDDPLNYAPEIVNELESVIASLKIKYPISEVRISLANTFDSRYDSWRHAGKVGLREKYPLAVFVDMPNSIVPYDERDCRNHTV